MCVRNNALLLRTGKIYRSLQSETNKHLIREWTLSLSRRRPKAFSTECSFQINNRTPFPIACIFKFIFYCHIFVSVPPKFMRRIDTYTSARIRISYFYEAAHKNMSGALIYFGSPLAQVCIKCRLTSERPNLLSAALGAALHISGRSFADDAGAHPSRLAQDRCNYRQRAVCTLAWRTAITPISLCFNYLSGSRLPTCLGRGGARRSQWRRSGKSAKPACSQLTLCLLQNYMHKLRCRPGRRA